MLCQHTDFVGRSRGEEALSMEGGRRWIALAVTLTSYSLGVNGILALLGSILSFFAGVVVLWYGLSTSDVYMKASISLRNALKRKDAKPLLACRMPELNGRDADTMTVLTGFPQIDTPLNEIIAFVFRDFVFSWHFYLTHSSSFPAEAEETLHCMIANLADKIRQVDWIPFLTTVLVDDVASHVKLFKKSRLGLRSKLKEESGKAPDLETLFFDAEVAMEGDVCRDLVSTIHQEELNYLQNVTEILLFLLMPEVDFVVSPLRVLLRDIVVNSVLKPMLDLVSEPDFINQTLVLLYNDYKIKPDVFSNAIRSSESVDELTATHEMVNNEISFLRSNDSNSEADSTLKQQLNSLLYLRKVINGRIHQIQNGSDSDSIGIPSRIDWNLMIEPGKLRLFVLPLEVILKNNIAIGYFIDFMTSIGCQSYVFFSLNVEGWKWSAEQQIQALELDAIRKANDDGGGGGGGDDGDRMSDQQRSSLLENMREAAHSIYEEYLSDRANPKLKIDESMVKRLLFKVRTEPPTPSWFDEVQTFVHCKMGQDERFVESFRHTYGYVKLLADLDLLKDATKPDDEDSTSLNEDFSIYDSVSLDSFDSYTTTEDKRSKSHSGDESSSSRSPDSENRVGKPGHRRTGSNVSAGLRHDPSEITAATAIEARVIDVATVRDGVRSYAVYTLLVKVSGSRGNEELRHVYRRYSDFHALHEKLCCQFPNLSKLPFPNKKTFGNMDKALLNRRRCALDDYLKELLKPATLRQNFGLIIFLERFLDYASNYEKERQETGSNVMKAVGSVKNSVKNVTNVVSAAPNIFIDNVKDGLTKALHLKQGEPNSSSSISNEKVGASIDTETSDNIPLRILLLFMDEVFDLQERHQWLRRQIVTVLRQLIKAMFGDIVNRRIVDYFAQMTSPEHIGTYLESFKNNRWPDGYPAARTEPRDENTKMRTRVAARAALLSSFSDDLRRVVGSETSRTGLLMIFDMLQRPVLNKRLGIVVLEGVLRTLFQHQQFDVIFQKLHSRSTRVRNELKNSKRTFSTIRR